MWSRTIVRSFFFDGRHRGLRLGVALRRGGAQPVQRLRLVFAKGARAFVVRGVKRQLGIGIVANRGLIEPLHGVGLRGSVVRIGKEPECQRGLRHGVAKSPPPCATK